MTAAGLPRPARAVGVHPGLLLDAVYLVAVISAVALGGLTQLALAVPVAGLVGVRAARRRHAPPRTARPMTPRVH